MSDDNNSTTISCGGCLSLIVAVILIWALIFGLRINGKQYNMGCSCDRGVDINTP